MLVLAIGQGNGKGEIIRPHLPIKLRIAKVDIAAIARINVAWCLYPFWE
jgi:hypothetical protein